MFEAWAKDVSKEPALRIAALKFLGERKSLAIPELISAMRQDKLDTIRAAALELHAIKNPATAVAELLAVVASATATPWEKQSAIAVLPKLKSKEANDAIDNLAERLLTPDFPKDLIVDVLDLIRVAPTAKRDDFRRKFEAPLPKDASGRYMFSLNGGNAEKGRELFFNHTGAQCVRCHKVGNAGGVAGPDLTEVAKRNPERTRDYLLESLVNPSAKIAPGFGTLTVNLDDGRVLTGVLLEETKTAVTLQLPDGKKTTVPKEGIEKRSEIVSPMPSIDRTLTAREMRDLIEFLSTLK
jgi:quinoprotein glucose dehydrogenase